MKRVLIPVFVLLIFSLFNSCKKEKDDFENIDQLVCGIPKLSDPVSAAPAELIGSQDTTLIDVNGTEYLCTRNDFKYANNMDKIVALNSNSGSLYPGSLVQGNTVSTGVLNSIGNFERAPIILTMNNYGQSEPVSQPSDATVDAAIQKMVERNTLDPTADLTIQTKEMYSYDQAMLEAGIDIAWIGGGLTGSISSQTSATKNSILIVFTQAYYTISADQPSRPSGFFDTSVRADELSTRISNGNPLCYVSSVTYGRMLIARITSTASLSDLKAAASASIGGFQGNVTYSSNSILENSEFQVMIIGGNTTAAANAVTAAPQERMAAIAAYINSGAEFGPNSRGYPISYVIRNACDNSQVRVGKSIEYSTLDNCTAQKTVSIHFDNFKIVKDCDEEIIGNDPGDFTYEINIYQDDTWIDGFSVQQINTFSNNGFFDIDRGPYEYTIREGSALKINGQLRDHDNPDPDDLLVIQISYSYPFSTIPFVDTQYEELLNAGSNCQAKFYYTMRRIN